MALYDGQNLCSFVLNILSLEELLHHTRPSSIPTGTTLRNILSILLPNDILARLGVIHHGLLVREEAIEAPVEDTSGDEGVDVSDGEPVYY